MRCTADAISASEADAYDLVRVVDEVRGGELRRRIVEAGATLVVRPDGGDPRTVPVRIVQALAERFGRSVNAKGHEVLPPCVRVIQGNGIT